MASTYRNLRLDARRDLEQAGNPSAEPESMILLMSASGKSREEILRDDDLYAPDDVIENYRNLVRRRRKEEPLAYLLGEWEFRGMDFYVDNTALIPRYDTKILAALAVSELEKLSGKSRLLDLCAGTGCVGISVAAEVKTSELEEMQGTPAAVYLKGAFAGNVVLEPDMTKESYDLSLGVDESVKVKRVQKKRHTSQLLLKGQKKTEYEYELTLTSRKEKEVSVSVTDQLPIPDDKSIQVEALDISGAVREEGTGLLRWTFPLAPGETKTLTLAYSVSWPKDKLTEEIQVRI